MLRIVFLPFVTTPVRLARLQATLTATPAKTTHTSSQLRQQAAYATTATPPLLTRAIASLRTVTPLAQLAPARLQTIARPVTILQLWQAQRLPHVSAITGTTRIRLLITVCCAIRLVMYVMRGRKTTACGVSVTQVWEALHLHHASAMLGLLLPQTPDFASLVVAILPVRPAWAQLRMTV
jgi:hypothetical protein